MSEVKKSSNLCECGNPLFIYDQIFQDKWRVGFKLMCKSCENKYTYRQGKLSKD